MADRLGYVVIEWDPYKRPEVTADGLFAERGDVERLLARCRNLARPHWRYTLAEVLPVEDEGEVPDVVA